MTTPCPFTAEELAAIRKRFRHTEQDPFGNHWTYLDAAVGSLVLDSVARQVAGLGGFGWNAGGVYPASGRYGHIIRRGRELTRLLLGARDAARIVTGESATALANQVARATVSTLPAGHKVLITATDHDANTDAWWWAAREAGRAEDVLVVPFDPRSGTLDLAALRSLCDRHPIGLLAVSAASNILGSINPILAISTILRQAHPDAYLCVDGVHAIPHQFPTPVTWDVDLFLFSPYKIYSHHGSGVAYMSERLQALEHPHLRSAATSPPGNWEQGSRNPLVFAGLEKIITYHVELGLAEGMFARDIEIEEEADGFCYASLQRAWERAIGHGRALTERLLWGGDGREGLAAMGHVIIHGNSEREHSAAREPTVSFSVTGMGARQVCQRVWDSHQVAIRDLDGYVAHTFAQLGITECVRVSAGHYNSLADIDRFLEAVQALAS